MGTCFCGNFHGNSLVCHSQTLHDSCCSLLCLVHGRFKDPSNLVLELIIALIWNIQSPLQFSECWNSRVKTITIDWCNHNGARTSDFGLLQKDRSRVQSRLITTNYKEYMPICISQSAHNNLCLCYCISTSLKSHFDLQMTIHV